MSVRAHLVYSWGKSVAVANLFLWSATRSHSHWFRPVGWWGTTLTRKIPRNQWWFPNVPLHFDCSNCSYRDEISQCQTNFRFAANFVNSPKSLRHNDTDPMWCVQPLDCPIDHPTLCRMPFGSCCNGKPLIRQCFDDNLIKRTTFLIKTHWPINRLTDSPINALNLTQMIHQD